MAEIDVEFLRRLRIVRPTVTVSRATQLDLVALQAFQGDPAIQFATIVIV